MNNHAYQDHLNNLNQMPQPAQPPPRQAVSLPDIISFRIGLSQIPTPSNDLLQAIASFDRIILIFAQSLTAETPQPQGPTQ